VKSLDANVVTEKASTEISSCYAVHIASTSPVKVCNWDVDVNYDGNTYTGGIPIKKPRISANYTSGGSIQIGNVDGTFTSLMLNGSLKKKAIYVYEIFLDSNNAVIGAETLYSGIVGGQSISGVFFNITLRPQAEGDVLLTPRRRIVPSCGFILGDEACGYTGTSSYCPRTYEGCLNHGDPFGGFRFIPKPGKVFAWGNLTITVE